MSTFQSDTEKVGAKDIATLHDWMVTSESGLSPRLEPAINRWRSSAAEVDNLLASERKALSDARQALVMIQESLDARDDEIATLTDLLRGRDHSPKTGADFDLQRKLDVNTREIATLSRLLKAAEDDLRWLGTVHEAVTRCPWWWRFMPLRWQKRKQSERLKRRGLFDGKAYLERYPDVAHAGADPLRHYITSGQAEGRLR